MRYCTWALSKSASSKFHLPGGRQDPMLESSGPASASHWPGSSWHSQCSAADASSCPPRASFEPTSGTSPGAARARPSACKLLRGAACGCVGSATCKNSPLPLRFFQIPWNSLKFLYISLKSTWAKCISKPFWLPCLAWIQMAAFSCRLSSFRCAKSSNFAIDIR